MVKCVSMFTFCILFQQTSYHLENKVCFKYLGCFESRYPFNNALGRVPDLPCDVNVRTYLWTRANRTAPQELKYTDPTSISKSTFDPGKKTYILIHGYMSGTDKAVVVDMVAALLVKGDFNVIGVDWSHGAKASYPRAAANTRVTGAVGAKLVSILVVKFGLQLTRLHVIGHSLGAYVAGYIGRRIPGIQRITGLDPAGPLFTHTDPAVRLDPTDAIFVDVIHTDAGQLLHAKFGSFQAMGHIDFYLNGGGQQPGCPPAVKTTLWDLLNIHLTDAFEDLACSHSRSYQYFTESINSQCRFVAVPYLSWNPFTGGNSSRCGSLPCPEMGYNADKYSATGKYFLTTNAKSPFCVGDDGKQDGDPGDMTFPASG